MDNTIENELGTIAWQQEDTPKRLEGYVWLLCIVMVVVVLPFANGLADLLYILFS